jgi:hypothetical protein
LLFKFFFFVSFVFVDYSLLFLFLFASLAAKAASISAFIGASVNTLSCSSCLLWESFAFLGAAIRYFWDESTCKMGLEI